MTFFALLLLIAVVCGVFYGMITLATYLVGDTLIGMAIGAFVAWAAVMAFVMQDW